MEATRQAIMGQGLPPEAPWVVFDFPLFLVDSDLTPIKEKHGEIVDALTKWQPGNNRTGVFNKKPVVVSGSSYEDALARANYLFLKNDHPSLAMWLAGVTLLGNVEIELPGGWDDLLEQAEQDLGPLPAV